MVANNPAKKIPFATVGKIFKPNIGRESALTESSGTNSLLYSPADIVRKSNKAQNPIEIKIPRLAIEADFAAIHL